MANYKRLLDFSGAVSVRVILRIEDNAFIPIGSGNRDDVEYQAWLVAGNTPLPADPLPTFAEITLVFRAAALAILDASDGNSKAERALLLVIIDEFNILRQRFNDLAVDVGNATSLADLKTRWAVHPSLANRDISQVKPAWQTKVSTGLAD